VAGSKAVSAPRFFGQALGRHLRFASGLKAFLALACRTFSAGEVRNGEPDRAASGTHGRLPSFLARSTSVRTKCKASGRRGVAWAMGAERAVCARIAAMALRRLVLLDGATKTVTWHYTSIFSIRTWSPATLKSQGAGFDPAAVSRSFWPSHHHRQPAYDKGVVGCRRWSDPARGRAI